MELVKNIFFNTDKLIENSVVKISYTGKFYQDQEEKVFIHYGFGPNWENVSDKEMVKTELGFQAEIDIIGAESLNIVFKTDDDKWDNNDNQNYTFNIEPAPMALTVVEEPKPLRKLRKTYLWSKKVKIAILKIMKYVPKLISGNYTKKVDNKD